MSVSVACLCVNFDDQQMYSGSNLYLFIYHFLNRHAGGVGDQVSATWGLLCIDCIPIYTPLVMHNISTAELQMVC